MVTKLFNAAEPDYAYFGQKDAAQVAVLRRMTRDLALGVELVVCPIVREQDGLAMSSRNRYLSAEERADALVLSRALKAMEGRYRVGVRDGAALRAAAAEVFAGMPQVRVDYIALVNWETLEPADEAVPGTLAAVAAWVGTTRLIDNLIRDGYWLENGSRWNRWCDNRCWWRDGSRRSTKMKRADPRREHQQADNHRASEADWQNRRWDRVDDCSRNIVGGHVWCDCWRRRNARAGVRVIHSTGTHFPNLR